MPVDLCMHYGTREWDLHRTPINPCFMHDELLDVATVDDIFLATNDDKPFLTPPSCPESHPDALPVDKICSFNRHYAEFAGYWQQTTFLSETDPNTITTFYDTVTGLPLFNAPVGRSFEVWAQPLADCLNPMCKADMKFPC